MIEIERLDGPRIEVSPVVLNDPAILVDPETGATEKVVAAYYEEVDGEYKEIPLGRIVTQNVITEVKGYQGGVSRGNGISVQGLVGDGVVYDMIASHGYYHQQSYAVRHFAQEKVLKTALTLEEDATGIILARLGLQPQKKKGFLGRLLIK